MTHVPHDPDLIIIGAGPAGLSAAMEATGRGLSVLVLDENAAPGGRIWQALEARDPTDADEAAAIDILHQFRDGPAEFRASATVWAIEPDRMVYWSQDGGAHRAQPRMILLATGATERPMPFPGWTLPGIMAVGAAQIAMKTAGLVPAGNTWIAGQGPLLMLYVVQALRAGGRIEGILDLSDPVARRSALSRLPGALPAWRDLAKGLSWRRQIAQAGIPWLRACNLRAEGDGALSHIAFNAAGGRRREAADLLLLHDGIIPSLQLSRALGCAHEWSSQQQCWRPVTNAWGQSSLPHVLIAGDGAGIGGAAAAATSGRIAALAAAHALGSIDAATRDAVARRLFAARRRQHAVRPLLDALYAPRPLHPDDATLVCRCEEVTAGQIREAASLGCLGLNQLKAFTRCGMGPCQGRMCAPIAAQVMAQARGVAVPDIEPLRPRFPTRPVTVGEVASLAEGG